MSHDQCHMGDLTCDDRHMIHEVTCSIHKCKYEKSLQPKQKKTATKISTT